MTDNTGPACAGARLAWPADSADRTEPLTRMREAATAAAVDVDMLSDDIRALYQFATARWHAATGMRRYRGSAPWLISRSGDCAAPWQKRSATVPPWGTCSRPDVAGQTQSARRGEMPANHP